jgi:HEAT repeat protein
MTLRLSALILSLLALAACGGKKEPEPLTLSSENRAVAYLVTQFHDKDPTVRANCIEALQLAHDPRAQEVIEQGLHDDQWLVRFAAAMAAGKRKEPTVRPTIATLVTTDPNGSVRAACVFALRRYGDSTYMSTLRDLLVARDPSTRANTALVLGLIGDQTAIPLLQSRASESDIRVRFEITAALARLGDERAQKIIVSWAVNEVAEAQWSAMTVCADLPWDVARDPLLLGLQPPPPPDSIRAGGGDPVQVTALTVRRQLVAARSLAILHNGLGAKVAVDNLQNSEPSLRALACLAVGEMLTPAQAAALEPLMKDPDEGVRRAAAAAIVKVFINQLSMP